jgi:hypothetical protein
MKLRDNRRADRGRLDDPVAELDRLAARLRDVDGQLAPADEQVKAAEEAERGLEGLAEELFAGTITPAEHDRRRAEVTHNLTTARRARDDLKATAAAGRRACEAEHASIVAAQVAAVDEQQDLLDRDLAAAIDRVRSLEALELLVAERRRSLGHGEPAWLALEARYDARTAARIAERKREAGSQLPPETPEQSRARQVDALLGARSLDYDGNVVPAYSRLPSDGSAVRIG